MSKPSDNRSIEIRRPTPAVPPFEVYIDETGEVTVMLCGTWLQEAGFDTGTEIEVNVREDGGLLLTAVGSTGPAPQLIGKRVFETVVQRMPGSA